MKLDGDFDVRRLQLQPGDWVVLVAKALSDAERVCIENNVMHLFPDNKVLVLDQQFDIAVLTAAQVAVAQAT